MKKKLTLMKRKWCKREHKRSRRDPTASSSDPSPVHRRSVVPARSARCGHKRQVVTRQPYRAAARCQAPLAARRREPVQTRRVYVGARHGGQLTTVDRSRHRSGGHC